MYVHAHMYIGMHVRIHIMYVVSSESLFAIFRFSFTRQITIQSASKNSSNSHHRFKP